MREQYRRMTPKERIDEMRELLDVAEAALRVHAPEEIRRRMEAADRIRRNSLDAFLEGLKALSPPHGTPAFR